MKKDLLKVVRRSYIAQRIARVRDGRPPFFCLENGQSLTAERTPKGRLDREMAPVEKEHTTESHDMQAEQAFSPKFHRLFVKHPPKIVHPYKNAYKNVPDASSSDVPGTFLSFYGR
jgi:hypothetical protein